MSKIGTPLQALKFAALLDADEAADFVRCWLDGSLEPDAWQTSYCDERTTIETPLVDFVAANPDEPERVAADGTVRKAHYGEGKQPWDFIREEAWAVEFAAGNALKYVRRAAAKNGADDVAKGAWYFARLVEMAADNRRPSEATVEKVRARYVLHRLRLLLTAEERAALGDPVLPSGTGADAPKTELYSGPPRR